MGSLLNMDTLVFERGKYEGKSLDEVAESDPEYLVFLIEDSHTDTDTKVTIDAYLDDHPDLLEGLEI